MTLAGGVETTVRRGWLGSKLRDVILFAGKRGRPVVNRVIAKHSEVGNPAFFNPDSFPWTKTLLENIDVIRSEAAAVMVHRAELPPIQEIAPDHSRLSNDGRWKSYILFGYGYQSEANCRRCPETTRLVSQVPGLQTAFYSILAPGKHIIPHHGVTKAIMTCHVPLFLATPREKC